MARQGADNLFFGMLVRGYVEEHLRFVRLDWLAMKLDDKLTETGKRFALLTVELGWQVMDSYSPIRPLWSSMRDFGT